jgi:hypothetical protein
VGDEEEAETKRRRRCATRGRPTVRDSFYIYYISGSACSTVGVHSQAWSTSGIGRLGSKSGRGYSVNRFIYR